jgi:hypothetical protein
MILPGTTTVRSHQTMDVGLTKLLPGGCWAHQTGIIY